MEYKCRSILGEGTGSTWSGTILWPEEGAGFIEAGIRARGSGFHVIIGTYRNGRYLCIPSWNVGCNLADLSDLYWNQEHLCEVLGKTDAVSISCALEKIDSLTKEGAMD